MKRLCKRFIPMLLVLAMVLPVSASAYSQDLYLNYSQEGSRVNFANTYSTNCSVLSNIVAMQVNLLVRNLSSGAVLCDTYNVGSPPSAQRITASWSRLNLPAGYYADEGVGLIRFIDSLSYQDETVIDSKVFAHNLNKAAPDGQTAPQALTEAELIERGNEILASFDSDPSDYTVIVEGLDLIAYMTAEAYLSIKQALDLQFGDTVPVYYLHPDGQSLIAVKQDAAGINYKYRFTKDTDGNWALQAEPSTVVGETLYRQEFLVEAGLVDPAKLEDLEK